MTSGALGADVTTLAILARLSAAAVLGGVLGLEREWFGKAAGLRTHMLVALGAACFCLVMVALVARPMDPRDPAPIQLDPTRVIAGVVSGIGFLGAGTILRRGRTVEGLTTAGSVWLAGSIGVACGLGEPVLALLAALLALGILHGLGRLERRWPGRGGRREE